MVPAKRAPRYGGRYGGETVGYYQLTSVTSVDVNYDVSRSMVIEGMRQERLSFVVWVLLLSIWTGNSRLFVDVLAVNQALRSNTSVTPYITQYLREMSGSQPSQPCMPPSDEDASRFGNGVSSMLI